jgi:DNA-binding NarL/FixJ family response regulator
MNSQEDFTEVATAEPWRILIADDHPLFRSALRQLLSRHVDLEVIAEAATGKEAVELCRLVRPDLVLMDIGMPKMDGNTATRQIKQELPSTAVLILTASENLDYLLEALEAGAAGYVLKHVPEQQVASAIRQTLAGESPLNQKLANQLLLRLVEEKKAGKHASLKTLSREHPEPRALEELTPREGEVLRHLIKGQANREIAKNLSISLSTAKQHVQHIIAKLGVSDRTQAVVKAIELGLHAGYEGD